jgi:YfiH family protein
MDLSLHSPSIFTPFPFFKIKIFNQKTLEKEPDHFAPPFLKDTICVEAKKMGLNQVVIPSLAHTSKIRLIEDPKSPVEADSVLVTKPDIAVAITHADCQATFILDAESKKFAAIHAGWRGLFEDIYIKSIKKMVDSGSNPKNLFVFVGPSLGLSWGTFLNYIKEIPECYHHLLIKPCNFDLKNIAKMHCISMGIPEKNIEVSPLCTAESHPYFSYRRAKKGGIDLKARNFTIGGICL